MQTNRWYPLLALGMLAVPIASRAQTIPAKGPQPKITEIGAIPGVSVDEIVKMPNGHVLVFGAYDDQDEGYLASYDLTTKRITPISQGWQQDVVLSPHGDRIAYSRESEDHKFDNLWTIPIDPASGKPTGSPQRMAVDASGAQSFSPDGRLLAYALGLSSMAKNGARTQSLLVSPATGGTPRVVARYDMMIQQTSWSADGRWIYVQLGQSSPNKSYSIERVPSAGGKSEVLVSGPESIFGWIENQITFYRPATTTGEHPYVIAGGGRGAFNIPAGSYFGTGPTTPRPLVTRETTRDTLQILNLENGKVIDLPFEGTNKPTAMWSPDQKRLLIASGEDQNREFVVMNADGSGQRRYPVKNGGLSSRSWSPDGKSIVYVADSGREIRTLNLANGISLVVATPPAKNRFWGQFFWHPDGKSFRTMTFKLDPATGIAAYNNSSVVDIGLDGSRRAVREFSPIEFPSILQAILTSARQAVVEVGDTVKKTPTRFILVPLDGGAARPTPMPTLESGMTLGFVTGYSEKWLTVTLYQASPPAAVPGRVPVGLLVMSTGTDTTRLIRYAPNRYLPPPLLDLVLPDGEHLAKIGRQPGDKNYTLYSVPIDGSAARPIGTRSKPIRGYTGWDAGLSTNGKQFAFFSDGPSTTHVYDIDLTPILNLVKKP